MIIDEFWEWCDQSSGPDACWPWTRGRVPYGYGSVYNGECQVMTHRVAYEKAVGEIPPGMVVMHTCDNPPCCNPAHLRVGSHAQNVHDCKDKGRQRTGVSRGSQNGKARLTESDVVSIRTRYTGVYGEQSAFAREFGVHPDTILQIIHRRTWTHV